MKNCIKVLCFMNYFCARYDVVERGPLIFQTMNLFDRIVKVNQRLQRFKDSKHGMCMVIAHFHCISKFLNLNDLKGVYEDYTLGIGRTLWTIPVREFNFQLVALVPYSEIAKTKRLFFVSIVVF